MAAFIAWRQANRAAYKAKDRARRRGAKTAEHVDPAEIFARDGYRCQLCGKRLAMSQPFPHPRSPTLDHIVPVAKGGKHERRNVQAAHAMCNSLKRDQGEDQLLLFG